MRIFFALVVVAISLTSAPAQSCFGIPPLRPVMPCPAGLKPLCLCGSNSANCHWEWACPSSNGLSTRGTATQLDPSIPLQVKPPTLNDPADTMRKIQEIRQMQQQTELLRQQTEAIRQQNELLLAAPAAQPIDYTVFTEALRKQNEVLLAAPAAQPIDYAAMAKQAEGTPLPAPAQPAPAHGSDPTVTGTLLNGRFWRPMDDHAKLLWLRAYHEGLMTAFISSPSTVRENLIAQVGNLFPNGLSYGEIISAIDQFYNTPENGPIAISLALKVVVLKSVGVEQSKIDDFVSGLRRDAARRIPASGEKQ
jgi:hypothetical protein